MNTPAHAPFAPSAMERIALCPGSYQACAEAPEHVSPYAADGTEAHATLQWCLENGTPPIRLLHVPNWTHRADTRDERIASIQLVYEYVNEITDAHDDAIVYFEKRVTFPSMLTTDCWGTLDIVIILPSLGWLFVIDFKHGSGKYVEVIDNLQLGTYATAALSDLYAGIDITDVYTVIVQPRAWAKDGETIRVECKSASYYRDVFTDKIDGIISDAMLGSAPLVPGKVQCQFCPRRMNCPAREAAALRVATTEFTNIRDINRVSLTAPEHMSLDTLAMVLNGAGVLQDWLNDIQKVAKQYLLAGTLVPGYKLVSSQDRRYWEGENSDIADMLCNLTGLSTDHVFPRKLISITEAEALIVASFKANAPRGKKTEAASEAKRAMADLTTRKSSGRYKVVPLDDRRPAINVAQADFGAIAAAIHNENEED